MIFESQYRRKALDKWDSEREEAKQEFKKIVENHKHLKYHPVKYIVAIISALFIQQ